MLPITVCFGSETTATPDGAAPSRRANAEEIVIPTSAGSVGRSSMAVARCDGGMTPRKLVNVPAGKNWPYWLKIHGGLRGIVSVLGGGSGMPGDVPVIPMSNT